MKLGEKIDGEPYNSASLGVTNHASHILKHMNEYSAGLDTLNQNPINFFYINIKI